MSVGVLISQSEGSQVAFRGAFIDKIRTCASSDYSDTFSSDHRPAGRPTGDLKGKIDHTEYVIGSLLLYMTFAELRGRAYDILYEYHSEARQRNATQPTPTATRRSRAHSIFSAEDTRGPQTLCFNFLVQIQAIAPTTLSPARSRTPMFPTLSAGTCIVNILFRRVDISFSPGNV